MTIIHRPGKLIIDTEDRRVEIDDTPELRQAIFLQLMAFLGKENCWSGEAWMQTDGPQINVHEFMSDLLDDTIKAKVEYKES
jgi:hypothetical protein